LGYYSDMSYAINGAVCDRQKVKELEDYFADIENHDVYGFYEVKLSLSENGKLKDIWLGEYYAKFYDDRLFVDKLSHCLIEGNVKVEFVGEDGDKWGYFVSPGHIEEIIYVPMKKSTYMKLKEIIQNAESEYINFALKSWKQQRQKTKGGKDA